MQSHHPNRRLILAQRRRVAPRLAFRRLIPLKSKLPIPPLRERLEWLGLDRRRCQRGLLKFHIV